MDYYQINQELIANGISVFSVSTEQYRQLRQQLRKTYGLRITFDTKVAWGVAICRVSLTDRWLCAHY